MFERSEIPAANSAIRRVLTLAEYYDPGYKGGGPIVSIRRIAQKLSGDHLFFIVTRGHDLGESRPFEGVELDCWLKGHDDYRYYCSSDSLSLKLLEKLIRETQPDVIYANSYFSVQTRSLMLLRALGRARGPAVLLAPRGEFSVGALQLKSFKKKAYMRVLMTIGAHDGVVWHASTPLEEADIRRVIRDPAHVIVVAPDIMFEPSKTFDQVARPPKKKGAATFVFISRISRKKNLSGALKLLDELRGDVELKIIGPKEDGGYWNECRQLIAKLPPNVQVEDIGSIPPDLMAAELTKCHFFLFPTLGENFGHVIPETMARGCVPILSDQTPWLDLDGKGSGFVLPLGNEKSWRRRLQSCVEMNQAEYARMSEQSWRYCRQKFEEEECVDVNQALFSIAGQRR